VALAAIAEDGDLLAGDQVQIAIGVVVNLHGTRPWLIVLPGIHQAGKAQRLSGNGSRRKPKRVCL
jgi:hypothetical protein